MKRQTEDSTWMGVAEVIAERSKCTVKVGAVIVSADGRIQATGYNGVPAGYYKPDAGVSGCESYCDRSAGVRPKDPAFNDCPANHAEINALLYSDYTRRQGGTIVVTKAPCMACAKAIANSGLKLVLIPSNSTSKSRNIQEVIDFLEKCGIDTQGVWQ